MALFLLMQGEGATGVPVQNCEKQAENGAISDTPPAFSKFLSDLFDGQFSEFLTAARREAPDSPSGVGGG
jgi:hypothetical protein